MQIEPQSHDKPILNRPIERRRTCEIEQEKTRNNLTTDRPKARKWSRIGQICRGAAISQANRERSSANPGGIRWLATEMKIITNLYPDYKSILKQLPHRTMSQVKNFTHTYGIATKRHVWTNQEISKLKNAAREAKSGREIYKLFPDFSKGQLRYAASWYRIPWPIEPLVMLGVPVLDSVRQRASEMNLSLIDLDEVTGGGKYFQKSEKRLDLKRVDRAIAYMGGTLTVAWPDEPT